MIIANELTLWQVTLLGLFFVFNCCCFCPLIDDEVVKVKTGERRRQYVFASSQKDKY